MIAFFVALTALFEEQPQEGLVPPKVLSGSITNADYPAAALRVEAEGTAKVRLSIDAAGRVVECVIVATSGNSTLDETSCALLRRRFRFEPARNAAGAAIPSTYGTAIAWRLPQRILVPFAPNEHDMIVTMANGHAVDCKVGSQTGAPPVLPSALVCPSRFSPAPPPFPQDGTMRTRLVLRTEGGFPSTLIVMRNSLTAEAEVQVDEAGKVSACRAELNNKPHPEPAVLCGPLMNGRQIFEAAPGAGARRAWVTASVTFEAAKPR